MRQHTQATALTLAATLGMLLVSSSAARAAVLVGFDYDHNTAAVAWNDDWSTPAVQAAVAPSTVATGLTVSDPVNQGFETTGSGQVVRFASPTSPSYNDTTPFLIFGGNDTTTFDHYWSFTVTPDSAQPVAYQALSFDTMAYEDGNSTLSNLKVTAIVNSGPEQSLGEWDSVNLNRNPPDPSRDFVNFDFADFSSVATVEFRIYGRGAQTNHPEYGITLDNLTLQGVVPEPTTLALLGVGGVLMLSRRRQASNLHGATAS